MYTLSSAAKATGVSKSTLSRELNDGTISANKDGKGRWQIEPSELHRVHKALPSGGTLESRSEPSHETFRNTLGTHENATENSVLQVKLDAAEKLAAERESELHHRDVTISHLRDELAEEKRERRETQTKLTALLTDQRETTPAPSKKPVNYPLWALVIGLFGVVIWVLLGQGG